MSNEVRLFKTVARLINKFVPGMREENRVTLAYLITGIIGSQNVQLGQVASKMVYPGKETSLVERFRRFLRNENISSQSQKYLEGSSFCGLLSWASDRFGRG